MGPWDDAGLSDRAVSPAHAVRGFPLGAPRWSNPRRTAPAPGRRMIAASSRPAQRLGGRRKDYFHNSHMDLRYDSGVCEQTIELIGASHFAGAGRDALPRVRRCMSRRFFLLFLRTRSTAIGTEALFHSLTRCSPSKDVRCRIARSASLPVTTASANQSANLVYLDSSDPES